MSELSNDEYNSIIISVTIIVQRSDSEHHFDLRRTFRHPVHSWYPQYLMVAGGVMAVLELVCEHGGWIMREWSRDTMSTHNLRG